MSCCTPKTETKAVGNGKRRQTTTEQATHQPTHLHTQTQASKGIEEITLSTTVKMPRSGGSQPAGSVVVVPSVRLAIFASSDASDVDIVRQRLLACSLDDEEWNVLADLTVACTPADSELPQVLPEDVGVHATVGADTERDGAERSDEPGFKPPVFSTQGASERAGFRKMKISEGMQGENPPFLIITKEDVLR